MHQILDKISRLCRITRSICLNKRWLDNSHKQQRLNRLSNKLQAYSPPMDMGGFKAQILSLQQVRQKLVRTHKDHKFLIVALSPKLQGLCQGSIQETLTQKADIRTSIRLGVSHTAQVLSQKRLREEEPTSLTYKRKKQKSTSLEDSIKRSR